MATTNIIILCDSHHGVYLPNVWAGNTENLWNINREDWEYIADPGNVEKEDYWDLWESILTNAKYVDSTGKTWTLHHDGDLFAVALDNMTEQEKLTFFEDY